MIRSLAEVAKANTVPHWIYGNRQHFFTGDVHGNRVSFLQAPVGAPGTVMIMEELIACEAKVFLGLGWAGSLQPAA